VDAEVAEGSTPGALGAEVANMKAVSNRQGEEESQTLFGDGHIDRNDFDDHDENEDHEHWMETSERPSGGPSRSLYPTVSPSPTAGPSTSAAPTTVPSSVPTVESHCEGSDPETCGCWSVDQGDYRGTIAVTAEGEECGRWENGGGHNPADYPHSGLEENYCRNPIPNYLGHRKAFCRGAYNFIDEPCDVPYCFPLPSSCDGMDFVTGDDNSNERKAACDYSRCLEGTGDYDGGTISVTRKDAHPHCSCPFEIWNCQFGNSADTCQNTLKWRISHECCLEKSDDPNWTYKDSSCDCSTKPDCENGNARQCLGYAENCCYESDDACKCKYKTKACRLAMEAQDIEGQKIWCNDARDTCCGKNYDVGQCKCDFWEPLCMDPDLLSSWNKEGDGSVCTMRQGELDDGTDIPPDVAISCCSAVNGYHCGCDLVNFSAQHSASLVSSEHNSVCIMASMSEPHSLEIEASNTSNLH